MRLQQRRPALRGIARRGWALALAGALLACTAAGCQSGDAPATGVQEPPAPAAAPQGGDESAAPAAVQQPAYRFPLTGQVSVKPVHDRPVAVMVENAPQARPQSGLDQADLVYEILAEGEVTRFVAVYQAQAPKVIGPVRSIRPYFVELGEALDAVIVHAGWSQDAMDLMAEHKLNHLDEVYGDGAYYWRSSERKMPHNLYTSLEKIREGAVNKKFREQWRAPEAAFTFAGTAAAAAVPAGAGTVAKAGTAANKVTMNYLLGYNVSYVYDAVTGLYQRFMEGEPHLDKETGKQLTAANILVCESKHQVLDNAGRRAVDVRGPGKGYLIQAGRMQEVTWELKNGVIRGYINGQEAEMLPGQTWIQVIPEGYGVQTE